MIVINVFFLENFMITKQTQGGILATYGRVTFNPLSAKVGKVPPNSPKPVQA
jgi:hypothetical protein